MVHGIITAVGNGGYFFCADSDGNAAEAPENEILRPIAEIMLRQFFDKVGTRLRPIQ